MIRFYAKGSQSLIEHAPSSPQETKMTLEDSFNICLSRVPLQRKLNFYDPTSVSPSETPLAMGHLLHPSN